MFIDMAPAIESLAEKITADEQAKEMLAAYQAKKLDANAVTFKFIPRILKLGKEECYTLLAAYRGMTVEYIKAQDISETLKELKELFTDKDVTAFFTSP